MRLLNPASAFVLLAFSASSFIKATPLEDLASPDQSVRDKAAAVQRATFRYTPESRWTPVIDKIKKGIHKKDVLEILIPFKVTEEGSAAGGGSYSKSVRLDDEWILTCWFTIDGDILFEKRLSQSLKPVDALLPNKNYTGRWVTYFPNGNKSHESELENGKRIGDFIAYYPNGSKRLVKHYTESGIDCDEIGYHQSGKVAHRGQYKDDKATGIWTWYDEAGNVTSTHEFPNQ